MPYEKATLGGGCFWCIEAVFERQPGVSDAVSGYAGGHMANPTYQAVCSGSSGHAEVVQITFDPQVLSYPDLLDLFFRAHDPTTLNRQGADRGTQYRSVIYTHDPAQAEEAQRAKARAAAYWPDPIVTEITPLDHFYPAEPYHQDYYRQNQAAPYCRAVISPKLAKLGIF